MQPRPVFLCNPSWRQVHSPASTAQVLALQVSIPSIPTTPHSVPSSVFLTFPPVILASTQTHSSIERVLISCLVEKLNSIFNLKFCKNQLHYTHYAKYFSNKSKFNSMTVRTNFMCQLPWTIDYPDIWLKMILPCLWECFWWDWHSNRPTPSLQGPR